MKSVISWHSSLHGDTRSAAQCGAVPGQQPTLLLGAGAIKAEMSLSPELDLARWPVSASARCVLREALGRSPSQGSSPSPTPLLSQSPTVWPNRMVWGTWAPHAESSEGAGHAGNPELHLRTVLISSVSLLAPAFFQPCPVHFQAKFFKFLH